jgi:hypothetical protein
VEVTKLGSENEEAGDVTLIDRGVLLVVVRRKTMSVACLLVLRGANYAHVQALGQ